MSLTVEEERTIDLGSSRWFRLQTGEDWDKANPSAFLTQGTVPMKTLLLLALTMAFGLLQTHGSLLDFQKMIRLATGKDAVSSYAFYGCYCGLGGRGSPKDATDRGKGQARGTGLPGAVGKQPQSHLLAAGACAAHDCCYSRLEKRGCGTKFLNYSFAYRKGQIVCGKQDYCRRQLCQCDKTAASCFARNRKTYKKQYQFYNNKHCHGKGHRC
ncbi:hypothetical protein QTO34_018990 [Cnephaeus nilssonii]|uniref:Phospholipase A2 n=1 Tax=Cnephaeus nilssonii TaxID=3371016 RepID=A0AA40HZW1_CNENI|nr:hypothetical protein QTO34_018990 [Eptesicus nilssonii]